MRVTNCRQSSVWSGSLPVSAGGGMQQRPLDSQVLPRPTRLSPSEKWSRCVCVCVCVNYHCMGLPQGCHRLSLCFSGSNKNTPKPFTELYPLEKTLQFFHVARDDVAEFGSCGFLTVFQWRQNIRKFFSSVSFVYDSLVTGRKTSAKNRHYCHTYARSLKYFSTIIKIESGDVAMFSREILLSLTSLLCQSTK